MSKQRNRRVSRKPIYLVLALSLLVAICFGLYKTYFSPAPAPILLINPVQLEYGQTTVTGKLQKDSPIGQQGSYFITLPDLRIIFLDVEGVDFIIGQNVIVEGSLVPSVPITNPPKMIVSKISVSEQL